MNKKEVVAPGREESISLKDNKILPKDIGKKKKPKQISLQKLDLGTNPINISSSNEFLDINNIFNFVKTRIKTILFLIFIIVIFVILFISFYYLLCFNYVYPKTQKEWIKASITIFVIMQILSVLKCLLETSLRFLSFRCKSEKLFKICKLLD